LHEEITADYSDMIYAITCEVFEARRKAFIRKWRLEHRAVAERRHERRATALWPRCLRTAARPALRNDLYPHMNVAEGAEFRPVGRVNKLPQS
jgi:hypothetical protein